MSVVAPAVCKVCKLKAEQSTFAVDGLLRCPECGSEKIRLGDGNAVTKKVTIFEIMSCLWFVRGYTEGLRRRPFDDWSVPARYQWEYERGRLFAAVVRTWYPGLAYRRIFSGDGRPTGEAATLYARHSDPRTGGVIL